MKVTGAATLHGSRDEVWRALNDPAVLVRTIPGCTRLEEIGPDAYRMTVAAGVASIKGVYSGEVRLTDQQPPDTFVLRAQGAGGPGTVSADVTVALSGSSDGATMLTYDADAIVGGMIGGVGQRMLSGVAKKTAGEFFAAVDDVLTGKAPAPSSTAAGDGQADVDGAAVSSSVFEAPGAGSHAPTAAGGAGFLPGALVGAGAALLGVIVGGWLSGRRRAS